MNFRRKESSLVLHCQLDKGAAASCRQLGVHIDPAASSGACRTSLLTGTAYHKFSLNDKCDKVTVIRKASKEKKTC